MIFRHVFPFLRTCPSNALLVRMAARQGQGKDRRSRRQLETRLIRQGPRPLRSELPVILSSRRACCFCSRRSLRNGDQRLKAVSSEIEALAEEDPDCQRLTTVPGIGPIISGNRDALADNVSDLRKALLECDHKLVSWPK